MPEQNVLFARRRAFLIAAVSALALTACGRKGPLEPAPGSPDAMRSEAARKAQADQPASATQQLGAGRRRRPPPITPPKGEPFVLDFLL